MLAGSVRACTGWAASTGLAGVAGGAGGGRGGAVSCAAGGAGGGACEHAKSAAATAAIRGTDMWDLLGRAGRSISVPSRHVAHRERECLERRGRELARETELGRGAEDHLALPHLDAGGQTSEKVSLLHARRLGKPGRLVGRT